MLQLTPSPHVSAHLIAAAWMAGISIVMAWMADRLNFFKWGKPQGPIPISGWALLELLALYLVISMFGPFALKDIVAAIGAKLGLSQAGWMLYFITALQLSTQILFALLASLYFFAHKRIDLRRIWKNSSSSRWKDLGIGMATWLVAFPTVAAVDGLMEAFNLYFFGTLGPPQNAIEFIRMLMRSSVYLWFGIVITIIIAPIIEEFIFRGCLQTFLRNRLSRWQAIGITSMAFSLVHFAPNQGEGNLPLLVSIFIFSLFLGFIYERQRSLFASIGLHAIFNAVSIFRLVLE